MIKEYNIPTTKDSLPIAVLAILNFSLKLTPLEMDMLVIMIKNNILVLNSKTREAFRKILNKDKSGFNNYVLRLRHKKVIVNGSKPKELIINPEILELIKNDTLIFKFNVSN